MSTLISSREIRTIYPLNKLINAPRIYLSNLLLITISSGKNLYILLLIRKNTFHYNYIKYYHNKKNISTKNFKVYDTEKDYLINKYPSIKNITTDDGVIYILPGGISSVNESIYDTLCREIYEETKLIINHKNINKDIMCVKIYGKELNITFYNVIYEYNKPFTLKKLIKGRSYKQ